MANPRAVLISLLIAVLAMALIWSFVNQQKTSILELATPQKVVVANQDIQALTTLDETMLRIDSVPKNYIQPGTYSEMRDILGLVTSVPIKKGEQVLQNKLLFEEAQTKLSTRIAKGKRAVTIPTPSDVHGVSRLIKPGDRVDILSSIDYGDGAKENREVKTVLQDVMVIATGRHIIAAVPTEVVKDPISGKEMKQDLRKVVYQSVTVEVSPEEAQSLVFLLTSGAGNIFLTLRNADDRSIEKLFTTDEDKVLGERSKKRQQQGIKTQRQPRWMEFRGTQMTPVY